MKPLNPIMAALVAAASATLASPGLALAKAAPAKKTATPTAMAAPAPADCLKSLNDAGTDAVNALTCLISNKPEARRDIGERLASWVQGKEPGRQYLKDDLLGDAAMMKSVLGVVRGWPEQNLKTPGSVAALYFVVGPQGADLPAWAQVAALKAKFKPKMGWSDRFATAMTSRGWSAAKQVAASQSADGVIALLNDAADQAQKVLADPRTKREIAESIAANDTTGPVIPTVNAGRKNPLDNTGAGFGFDDLYRKGAFTAQVFASKDDGYRELSMKIYTVRNDDGSLQNMIGIVDITDPARPYLPKYFPVTTTGEVKFTLRDGGRPYVMNVDGGNITLGRDGAKPGDGSASLNTTLSGLFTARAEQARAGAIVRIPEEGGKEYYVTGQGGASGTALFFPRETLDGAAGDVRTLRPAGIADVSQVDQDGVTVPVTWSPSIGKLPVGYNDDGSVKMAPFKLVFDARAKMWKPVAGEGDPDPRKKPKDAPKPGDGAKPGDSSPAGPSAPNPGNTSGTVPTGDAKTLDEVVAMAKQAGFIDHAAGNKGFDDATAALVRIMYTDENNKRLFSVFFDPSVGKKGNQANLNPVIGTDPLQDVRGVGRYVVMVFPKTEQYFSVKNYAGYLDGGKEGHPDLQWSEAQGFVDFDSVEGLIDTVKRKYTNVDAAFADTLRARVKKHAPNGGYHLNGAPSTTIVLKLGEKTRQIWPDDKDAPGTGSNAGMTTQKGPGTVFQLAGGPDGAFPENVSDGNWTRVSADEASGIALYSGTEYALGGSDGGTVPRKRYAIMVRYKKASGAARSKLITVFGDAKEDNDYFTKPSDLKLQGLKDQELGDTSILRMYANSTQEKGGIAAYRTPASSAGARDPKANCVGPVVWWGMTKGQAEEACRTDGKAD